MTKKKAKTILKDLDFSTNGCAIALVGPSVGGPATGKPVLAIKSMNFSPEHIEKASKVRVTMEFDEFLNRFFGIYYEDAEVLARLLGFEGEESEDEEWSWDKYIDERVASIEIMKSFKDKNKAEVLSSLTEEQHLQLLNDQASLEEVIKKAVSDKVAPEAAESDNSTNASVEKSVEPSGSKPKEKEITVEMVEKSAFVALQKSFDEQATLLKKATEDLEALQAAAKEAVVKAKTEKVKAVVKDEKELAVVLKAALAIGDDAEFESFVAFLEKSNKVIEKSELFKENGITVDTTGEQEHPVTKLLKSQYAKK